MKHGRHVRCQLDVLDGVEVRLGFLHVLAAMNRWGGGSGKGQPIGTAASTRSHRGMILDAIINVL